MVQSSANSAGGRITAKKLRQTAVHDYYKDPNKCLECQNIIRIKSHQKVRDVRIKKFCDLSCSARHNNKNLKRRKPPITGKCEMCGKVMHFRNRRRHRLCGAICRRELRAQNGIISLTKGEHFKRVGNYTTARSSIRRSSYKTYMRSKRPRACKICGYSTHIEVAHIKDVAEFPDNALISVINNMRNLVALCRNHHWEYEHGLIRLQSNAGGREKSPGSSHTASN